MKRIRFTVTEEYLLPDDFAVLTHPADHLLCLHGDLRHFLPAIEWSQRVPAAPSVNPGAVPRANWRSVRDARANWFLARCENRTTTIRKIK